MAVIGDPKSPLGVRALEALGLPSTKCTGLEIRFLPGSIVSAVATYIPDGEQAEKLVRVLKESEAK